MYTPRQVETKRVMSILHDTYGLARLPSGRFTLGLDFVVFIDSIRKLEIKLREREQIEMKVV